MILGWALTTGLEYTVKNCDREKLMSATREVVPPLLVGGRCPIGHGGLHRTNERVSLARRIMWAVFGSLAVTGDLQLQLRISTFWHGRNLIAVSDYWACRGVFLHDYSFHRRSYVRILPRAIPLLTFPIHFLAHPWHPLIVQPSSMLRLEHYCRRHCWLPQSVHSLWML